MGGQYPSGREYNFWGDNPYATAHVVNNWPGRMTFSGNELGENVLSGGRFSAEAAPTDPVAAAYKWYVGYNTSRYSWDPLTVLYACQGLGETFTYANHCGYNHVFANGSNAWMYEKTRSIQHWLQLKVSNASAGLLLDQLYIQGARSFGSSRLAVDSLHSEL